VRRVIRACKVSAGQSITPGDVPIHSVLHNLGGLFYDSERRTFYLHDDAPVSFLVKGLCDDQDVLSVVVERMKPDWQLHPRQAQHSLVNPIAAVEAPLQITGGTGRHLVTMSKCRQIQP